MALRSPDSCGGEPLARFEGENGVRVEVRDESRPYGYSNVFRVRLAVTAEVPRNPEPYRRVLERMGVWADDLDRARLELLQDFRTHSLPYLFHPDFPRRLAEERRRQRPKAALYAVGANR